MSGKTSDFITRGRALISQFMAAFGELRRFEHEAVITGRVVVDPETGNVTTNMTQEDFIGENSDVTIEDFLGAVAGIMLAASQVSDDIAAKMYRSQL